MPPAAPNSARQPQVNAVRPFSPADPNAARRPHANAARPFPPVDPNAARQPHVNAVLFKKITPDPIPLQYWLTY